MVEHDDNDIETAEKVGERILLVVKKAEFGSPQYQAISDWLDLEDLYDTLRADINNKANPLEIPTGRGLAETGTRIEEMQIALLEHEIRQKKAQVKGYDEAYSDIKLSFEGLGTLTNREAEKNYPDNKIYMELRAEEAYNDIIRKALEEIYRKRE